MAESAEDRYARWQWIHETAVMTGWDFGALGPRLVADDPPWDFDLTCAKAMARLQPCLDMGTGGGERLSRLVKSVSTVGGFISRRSSVHATEGWKPNLELATSALEKYGIEVREYDSETGQPMPWPDDYFTLVMNRHESYDPAELARVIAPDGRFLTQQVDGTEAGEFRLWFGGRPEAPENQLGPCLEELEAQGFTITDADEWTGMMEFADVEAIIEYLAYIPWDVPGFTVADNLVALNRLATRRTPIEVTQKRFRIAAQR
ncbi:MAG: class I SAM-dependent methyltransferase [Brevibacterium aurantiacum]|uniref:class I SAM-dependent methyltransferase n=1 Tax=Brevibacterium aurantiacum TaxID=273384 RepID=UPI003F90D0ED